MSIIQTNYKSIKRYGNMELINGNSEIIKDFFQSMERMLEGIGKLAKESRPHLNGEKFLSNREASKYLKVSIRTLQEWRDTGVIPYHSDKRQNNLPSKRYRTAFADLLQWRMAGITCYSLQYSYIFNNHPI